MPAGRPLKFKDVAQLQEKIDAYFASVEEPRVIGDNIYFEPITITGLALALDTSREGLCNYQERDEFFDAIKRAKLKVENYAERQLYLGKSAAGPIFALKNFDWSDKVQQDTTIKGDANNPLQHNHTGKIDMGTELIATAIERILGKNEKDTNDIQT